MTASASLKTLICAVWLSVPALARAALVAAPEPGYVRVASAEITSARADSALPGDPALARRTAWLVGGGVGVVYLYGLTSWWGAGFEPQFKAEREGWFGPDTDHGGQDKLGHFMFTYAGSRLLTWGFESLGRGRDPAIRLGTLTAYGALTGVEVIDGFAKTWSFSPEDLLMNTAGAITAVASERRPGFDRLLDFRINYWPSTRPDGSRRSWEPISDYSGQTYYLVTRAEGVEALDRIPLVRYLEFSLGYGARGFEDGGERARYTYVGVSLNLGKLMREHVLRDSGPRTRRVSDNLFEYVQFRPAGAWDERRF
jgi:hypothetical protein